MTTFGYINGELTEKILEAFKKEGVNKLLVNGNYGLEEDTIEFLNGIISKLSHSDKLVIYDFSNLKLTLTELTSFFRSLKEKKVDLKIINKDEAFSTMSDSEFIEFIEDLSKENQEVMKNRAQASANRHKRSGRPKISQETIDRINYLRHEKQYTLKDISIICNVSIGTAYKYLESKE